MRRLAYLKKQRQACATSSGDASARARSWRAASLALQNVHYDVLRLKAGGQTFQQVTQVAEKAMALAREVDNAVYVADEMAKLRGAPRDAGRPNR